MSEIERAWMMRALELAERGRGFVEPNPLVGAVLVQGSQVVGEGWHKRFGQAHAEVIALAAAGEAARDATLYVTLEPCCHHGKTPPCTDAVIRAGIRRVVAAVLDPFSRVAGQGVATLLSAGITVDVGLCEAEAKAINAPYFTLLQSGHPYVHAKWAMTLDGKICTRTGESKWITNEESKRCVHVLRGRMDAIVVGIGTVLADDPLLTARPAGPRTATRVVLDSQGRLPLDCRLVQTAREAPVMLVTLAENRRAEALRAAACEVLVIGSEQGRPPVKDLLIALGKRRFTNILVEGGAEVLGSFFDAKIVDEMWAFVAPTIFGGAGKSPVGGRGTDHIREALALASCQVEVLGSNVLIRGRVSGP